MKPCHHSDSGWCLPCMAGVAESLKPLLTGIITEADRQTARHFLARLGVEEPASCAELRTQLTELTEAIGRLPSGIGGKPLNEAFTRSINILSR